MKEDYVRGAIRKQPSVSIQPFPRASHQSVSTSSYSVATCRFLQLLLPRRRAAADARISSRSHLDIHTSCGSRHVRKRALFRKTDAERPTTSRKGIFLM